MKFDMLICYMVAMCLALLSCSNANGKGKFDKPRESDSTMSVDPDDFSENVDGKTLCKAERVSIMRYDSESDIITTWILTQDELASLIDLYSLHNYDEKPPLKMVRIASVTYYKRTNSVCIHLASSKRKATMPLEVYIVAIVESRPPDEKVYVKNIGTDSGTDL